jgi:hypothetical protein
MARARAARLEGGPSDRIAWRDERGRLVRCTPPPDRIGVQLSRGELVEWAEHWQVPAEAALQWFDQQPNRPPAWICLSAAETILDYPPRRLGVV